MDKKELIEKITQKKEFSNLPKKDVELAFEKFDKEKYLDEEKIKLTRDLLRKVYSSFTSRKLLGIKDGDVGWVLKKHKSTKERWPYYEEVYKRIFEGMGTQECIPKEGIPQLAREPATQARIPPRQCSRHKTSREAPRRCENLEDGRDFFEAPRRCENLFKAPNQVGLKENIQKDIFTRGAHFARTPKHFSKKMFTKGKISVIDLGAGVNGFSYGFFKNKKINYVGVEAVGQLVELTNYFFKSKKIKGKALHLSLFEIDEVKKLIKKQKKPLVVFLFKVIDSLEVLERNYSKKLLDEIVPLADKVVLSFATRSLGKRSKFGAQRLWIKKFIDETFEMLEDFEIGGEQYLVFQKDKNL